MSSLQDIKQKVLNSERITETESLTLFREGNLYDLGFLADFIRKKRHPGPMVTYVIDRNINYTDICISACKFCAFYKAPEDPEGSVISFEELEQKIAETKKLRGTQILLQGGLHPDKPLEFYEEMLRFIKKTGIHIHGFSPPEICHFSKLSGLSVAEVIERLKKSGLDSIPGGGAEILSDRVREKAARRLPRENVLQMSGLT
jgi:cyclic dehypoxanthinyl futalosine synthase